MCILLHLAYILQSTWPTQTVNSPPLLPEPCSHSLFLSSITVKQHAVSMATGGIEQTQRALVHNGREETCWQPQTVNRWGSIMISWEELNWCMFLCSHACVHIIRQGHLKNKCLNNHWAKCQFLKRHYYILLWGLRLSSIRLSCNVVHPSHFNTPHLASFRR